MQQQQQQQQPLLQFAPFSSAVEAPFWHTLADRKLDILKLDDATQPLRAYYSTGHTLDEGLALPARLCLGTGAFDVSEDQTSGIPPFTFPTMGSIKNTNTVDDFKNLDKASFFKEEAEKVRYLVQLSRTIPEHIKLRCRFFLMYASFCSFLDIIWRAIVSGDAVTQPNLLSHFLLLTYADLKKYKFYYWFGFPALLMEPSWVVGDNGAIKGVEEVWSQNEIESLRVNFDAYRDRNLRDGNATYFLVNKSKSSSELSVGRLSEWDTFFNGVTEEDRILGFADPSSLPSNPGWPLRNLLVLVHRQWNVRRIRVLCFREIQGKRDIRQSRMLVAEIPGLGDEKVRAGVVGTIVHRIDASFLGGIGYNVVECPKAVGWEKGVKGNLAPRMADLAPLMDPI
ncbi:LOW QUALITY PROTEIN: hypothetical protein BC937DRAFT_95397, partial [Endogone sp. FLAS-F59071]